MSGLRYLFVLVALLVMGLVLLGVSTRRFEYSYEVVVPTRYDTVWTQISDPDSLLNWFPGLQLTELDSGVFDRAPAHLFWTLELEEHGVVRIPVDLTHFDRPDTIEFKLQRPDAVKTVRLALHPLIDKNTLITGFYTWEPVGFFRRIRYRFNSLSLGFQDQLSLEGLRDHCRALKGVPDQK